MWLRLLAAAAAVMTATCRSQAAPALPGPVGRAVVARVAAYEKASRATVGVSVVALDSGESAVAIRPARRFIPASNQKLLTAAFALVRLGGRFHFETALWYLPTGDLLVAGDYDPTLGDPRLARQRNRSIYAELDRWARALKAAKIDRIGGQILLCRANDKDLRHPDWPTRQRQKWYAAPVGRLNFHNNCFDVTLEAGEGGTKARVTPASRFIRVVSQLRTGPRQLWWLQMLRDGSDLTLKGTIRGPTSRPTSIAIDHPALLFGRVLADRIARAGVQTDGRLRLIAPTAAAGLKGRLVAKTRTPLAEALKRANKRSLNMAAEAVFLRAGDGTWTGSAKLMAASLVKTFGLSPGSVVVRDGGGLSRGNAVTPRAMTTLLRGVLARKDGSALLVSLPISGVDGSMADRLTEARYRGRVAAKTGYIKGVSCLSGYVLSAKGKPRLAFAILVNRVRWLGGAKQLQDDICRLLVDGLGAK